MRVAAGRTGGKPVDEPVRSEKFVCHHCSRADHSDQLAESRSLENEIARRQRQRAPVDAFSDRREQKVTRSRDTASDDCERRIEETLR